MFAGAVQIPRTTKCAALGSVSTLSTTHRRGTILSQVFSYPPPTASSDHQLGAHHCSRDRIDDRLCPSKHLPHITTRRTQSAMPLIVIYNPACGDRTAKSFFESVVIPLLASYDADPDSVVETTHEGHAGEVVSEFLRSHYTPNTEEEITVVLGSGDGTLHEIINDLRFQPSLAGVKIRLALVPCGTANALYSSFFPPPAPDAALNNVEYKLQGVKALVEGEGKTAPISVSVAHFKSKETGQEGQVKKPVLSAVVTSTALHAALLNDSEKLRDEYPGLERYVRAPRTFRAYTELPQQVQSRCRAQRKEVVQSSCQASSFTLSELPRDIRPIIQLVRPRF